MTIGHVNGYAIHIPDSGGKAGRGYNVTGSVQVRGSNNIVKQYRFTMMVNASMQKAIHKATDFAKTLPPAK